jgi:hypothetical protein
VNAGDRVWPELPEGYTWDHSTSPSCIRGPFGFLKYSGGGPRQAARIAWAHFEGTEKLRRPLRLRYRRIELRDRVDLPGSETPMRMGYMQDFARDRLRHYWDDHGVRHPWYARAAMLLGVTL